MTSGFSRPEDFHFTLSEKKVDQLASVSQIRSKNKAPVPENITSTDTEQSRSSEADSRSATQKKFPPFMVP
jgi:hypothetical protein